MIFQETIDWVLEASPQTGQAKTSTLRVIKNTHRFDCWSGHVEIRNLESDTVLELCQQRARVSAVYSGVRKWRLYSVGAARAAQPGRGQPSRGMIEILGIKFALPATLTDLELHAEGFDTRERFEEVWARLHGTGKLHLPCWLIEFRKVGA